MKRSPRAAFTLIEVLIVVVILGILAATVLPQFTSANTEAKETALIQDLQTLRSQIQQYKYQHGGLLPGAGSTKSSDFKNCLLLSSDVKGTVGPAGTLPYGPYLDGTLPPNPYNAGKGVMIVPAIDAATANESAMDGTEKVGWIYSPNEGRLKGNNQDLAASGVPLSSL